MSARPDSPPASPRSPSSSSARPSLSLGALPPLVSPSPPSNTLLITNLLSPLFFQPQALSAFREFITAHYPLYSFSPLPSFRRIIVSFYTIEAAVQTRQLLESCRPSQLFSLPSRQLELAYEEEGNEIEAAGLKSIPRIYFGEPTPLPTDPANEDKHLHPPKPQKQFFISPPPSPPFGWTTRDEGPPNREIHAFDLERALRDLEETEPQDGRRAHEAQQQNEEGGPTEKVRRRSSVVYDPKDQGGQEGLPAVVVEDLSKREDADDEVGKDQVKERIAAHTARPPVELMS